MHSHFTEEQIKRYSRHIALSEIGGKGQKKLLTSSVFIVGAGGLGSPVGLYLAAAGVGKIGIVDYDKVELSNLQRQILHHTQDIGRLKVTSAAEAIADINPDVEIIQYNLKLTSENIMEIISNYDIIVEGSDNFPTKYLVNDACFFLRKPLVFAGILRFEGQVTLFLPGKGCLRCIWSSPPPPGLIPSCEEAGVLGVLPGIIGSIQAAEVIKLILGLGEPLVGKLMVFDALTMELQKFRWHPRPNCPLCGEKSTISKLIDYEEFCGISSMQT